MQQALVVSTTALQAAASPSSQQRAQLFDAASAFVQHLYSSERVPATHILSFVLSDVERSVAVPIARFLSGPSTSDAQLKRIMDDCVRDVVSAGGLPLGDCYDGCSVYHASSLRGEKRALATSQLLRDARDYASSVNAKRVDSLLSAFNAHALLLPPSTFRSNDASGNLLDLPFGKIGCVDIVNSIAACEHLNTMDGIPEGTAYLSHCAYELNTIGSDLRLFDQCWCVASLSCLSRRFAHAIDAIPASPAADFWQC